MGLSGGIALLTSVLIFVAAREPAGSPNLAFRIMCMKGKPCGNTCIALDKECHVDDPPPLPPSGGGGDGEGLGYLTRGGLAGGIVLGGVGVTLILLAALLPRRLQPRRIKCSTLGGCSLAVRF